MSIKQKVVETSEVVGTCPPPAPTPALTLETEKRNARQKRGKQSASVILLLKLH